MNHLISSVIYIDQLLKKSETTIMYSDNGENSKKYKLNSKRKYIIPGYQREIQWRRNNLQVLIDDLLVGNKFLGILLVSSSNEEDFEIIDGQQRMTVFYMILKRIFQKENENTGEEFTYCGFENDTFKYFWKVLTDEFASEIEESHIEEYRVSDFLEQESRIKDLWECVKQNIDGMSNIDRDTLKKNLLESTVNILIADTNKNDPSAKRVCADYFIDINNKSEKLQPSDILKAYAFREQYDNAATYWKKIQQACFRYENEHNIQYPKESMFLHYMLCTLGPVTNYKIKSISEDYKLNKKLIINDKVYDLGTDIEVLVKEPNYYKSMFKRVEQFQQFCETVSNSRKSPSIYFKGYFNEGAKLDDNSYDAIFIIIQDILKCSDVVPKMLLMKYFIDVIQNKKASKEEYYLIYPINVLATVFSAGNPNDKQSKVFAPIVLKNNWMEELTKRGLKYLESISSKVKLNKNVVSRDKDEIKNIGKYKASRVLAIIETYNISSSKCKPKIADYVKYRNPLVCNDEHFAINASGKISTKYRGEEVIEFEYQQKIYSKVCYIGNYIKLDPNLNKKIGNETIRNKIDMIKNELSGQANVLYGSVSQKNLNKADEIFSKCPSKAELDSCKTFEEAKNLLEEYYNSAFEQEFENFIEEIIENYKI